MWNDTDLQYHVEKELDWEPSVHTNQIGVVVKDGTVQLIGHVDSFWEKCAAERAVWRVAHVTSVTNEPAWIFPSVHCVRMTILLLRRWEALNGTA